MRATLSAPYCAVCQVKTKIGFACYFLPGIAGYQHTPAKARSSGCCMPTMAPRHSGVVIRRYEVLGAQIDDILWASLELELAATVSACMLHTHIVDLAFLAYGRERGRRCGLVSGEAWLALVALAALSKLRDTRKLCMFTPFVPLLFGVLSFSRSLQQPSMAAPPR